MVVLKEIWKGQGKPYIVLSEPQLLSGHHIIHDERPVVCDYRLELATQRVPLDPVHHVAAEAGTGGDAVIGVDVVEVVADIFPAFD